MGKQLDHHFHFEDEFILSDEPPSRYQVVLHNDNYTTMDFVVEVLQKFFSHSEEIAIEIMLAIHHKNKGICGVYPADIAETKVTLVTEYAKANQYPLRCTMEKE